MTNVERDLTTYEIANPSDKYTIECPDLEIAAAVALIVGRGAYGMVDITSGELAVPIFLGGGHDEWCQEKFGGNAQDLVGRALGARRSELADSLDPVVIGKRSLFEKLAPSRDDSGFEAFRAIWHDSNRSSMNDIGTYCYELASKLRKNGGTDE